MTSNTIDEEFTGVNPDPAQDAQGATPADGEKKKRRRRGNPGNFGKKKSQFKDWLRVVRSTGNSVENVRIHLVINVANNVVKFIAQAPKAEGSEELEEARTQYFRITSYDVINDPNEVITEPEQPAEQGKGEEAPQSN